jgi:sorting nexin-1/2
LFSYGSYVNYHIVTASNIPGYAYGETNVGRRYSDFTWLAQELSRFCAGVIVPALPEKQTVGRFSAEFVEARRRSLERFLLHIAAHPELNIAPVFISFLQANEDSLKEAKEASKAGIKKIGASLTSWFEGKVNALSAGKVRNDILILIFGVTNDRSVVKNFSCQ